MAASKMSISALFEDYRQWVVKHPDVLSQIESLGRITSYLIAGRVNKSPAFSEFLYSATNIIVLINDQILRSAELRNTSLEGNVFEKSRVLITTLEYLQVFLEIASYRLGGIQGKWITIFIIQLIKFLWRIFILIRNRAGLTATRPLPPLNRKQFKIQMLQHERNLAFNGIPRSPASTAFTLKSGRVIRKVEGAPQLHRRTWIPPAAAEETNQQTGIKTQLTGHPLLGEVIYTAKPLCHLLAINRFGLKSWVPWLLALSMDFSSLKLLEKGQFNREEKKEIHRRQMTLLMYLLRSPFYDRYSRRILSFFLLKLSRVPLVGLLPKHLNSYLPYWQNLYSYTWD